MSDHGGCGKIRRLAAPVEQLVASEVNRHYEYLADAGGSKAEQPDDDSIRRQLAADVQALDELARDRYVTRSITAAEFVAAREPLVQRIADAQEALQALAAPDLELAEPATGTGSLGAAAWDRSGP